MHAEAAGVCTGCQGSAWPKGAIGVVLWRLSALGSGVVGRPILLLGNLFLPLVILKMQRTSEASFDVAELFPQCERKSARTLIPQSVVSRQPVARQRTVQCSMIGIGHAYQLVVRRRSWLRQTQKPD
jgi:hypothetical protein